MIRRTALPLALVSSLAWAVPAASQAVSALKGHDTHAPVDVAADRIEVQDKANRAIFSGNVKVWHIFLLSFLTGSAQSFSGPAYISLLPLLVKREDMPNAVAMNSMQFNLARVIGPIFAGIALAAWGAAVCFAVNGLSFIAVIVALLMIRAPQVRSREEQGGLFEVKLKGFLA